MTNRTLSSCIVILALAAAAVGAHEALARRASATPLSSAVCSPVQNPGGDLLLASDLPLHGANREQAGQMAEAIAFELGRHGWQAGKLTLSYQSCDDSTALAGHWSATACTTNAARYAGNQTVIGVIGALNSGCTALELPVENRAPDGPLAVVSPTNTSVGLTHGGPGTAADEPARYYPTGKRNYATMLAGDDAQGAADAVLARGLGVQRLFILHDRAAYGEGVAADVASAAKKLDLTVVRTATWDPSAASYSALALQIAHSGAQAVFLGGLIGENGGRLIQSIRAAAPSVAIIAPTGFTPIATVVEQAGTAAEGMYVSVAGLSNDRLPRAGQAFVQAFSASLDGAAVDPASVAAAQATDVLLEAIGTSKGTRSAVAANLHSVVIAHGLLGSVSFDPTGAPTAGPVTIYKIVGGKATTYRVIVPKPSLFAAP